MTYVELSAKIKAVCKAYYEHRCGTCPLRGVCVEPYPLTVEHHNDHNRRLNELAETVELGVE